MQVLWDLLAVLGFLAAAWRAGRSAARALGRTAERAAAGHAADTRARQGDLTGMAEADAWHRRAGRLRRQALLTCVFWLVLLVAPAYTAWTRPLYAAYALLWLLEARPRRRPS